MASPLGEVIASITSEGTLTKLSANHPSPISTSLFQTVYNNRMVEISKIVSLAKKWSEMDPNPTTSEFVQNLIQKAESNDESAIKSLTALFPDDDSRISFGTAGLRAAMKPGPLAMNDLTVIQTAQGLAKYCLKNFSGDDKKKPCAVIGYDHRSNVDFQISSVSFAVWTALVFEQAGIESILMDGFVHTPMVPFVLRKVGAVVGIMVTASHNPKQDNGYKVYSSDSCQIRAPIDKEIATEILENLEPWTDYRKLLAEKKSQFQDPCLGLSRADTTKEMIDAYYEGLLSSGLKTGQAAAAMESSTNAIEPPVFAYTAMHGVGRPFAERVFQEFGLPALKCVPSQQDPDSSFPTVPFPNPEENGALNIAKQFAEDEGCCIVLANDPDADRLAVAERDRSTGEWTVFSGDQIGSMLGYWLWNQIGKSSEKVRRPM